MESVSLLLNSEPMDTTSNTLPSTTVSTTPHYTGNTLPQAGHNPPPYCYVRPTNAAFRNRQPATDLPPPYSEVAYLPRQQIYPNAYMVPCQTPSQQYMTPQQPLYVQQPQQMNLQLNGSTTAQNIDSPAPQDPVTIQDTSTQNPPPQTESSTSVTGNLTTPVSRENDSSTIDTSSTSNPTPQVPAIVAPPITTTANNSDIETHVSGPNTEETYEMVGVPVGNDDNVYESGEGPPSYSDLYDNTD